MEPLPEGVQKAIDEGAIREGKPKGQVAIEAMIAAGLPRQTAKEVEEISNKCMLSDTTKGVQYMNEVMELLIDGFEEAVKDGPLAREKCLRGARQHNRRYDTRGSCAQRTGADNASDKRAIYAGLLTAGVVLEEPKQNFTISIPLDYMSDVISFLQSKRGQIINIEQESGQVSILAKMPVAEVIKGFSNDLRGMTQGRRYGTQSSQDTRKCQRSCRTR